MPHAMPDFRMVTRMTDLLRPLELLQDQQTPTVISYTKYLVGIGNCASYWYFLFSNGETT